MGSREDSPGNILDGARALLTKSIDLLGAAGPDTIFVGGWGPYLRNSECHPGTKDVDILFPKHYTRDDIKKAVQPFLDEGFLLSAKHDFQLFWPYEIGEYRYIFNVDLLHPVIQKLKKAEFIDIIDLGTTIEGTIVKTVKTIGIVGGEVLFDAGLHEDTQVDGRSFRTLSPSGVVLSKLDSCHSPKRPRDIFDIHLSIQEDPNLGRQLTELATSYENIENQLARYRERLKKNRRFYSECLLEFNVEADDELFEQLALP